MRVQNVVKCITLLPSTFCWNNIEQEYIYILMYILYSVYIERKSIYIYVYIYIMNVIVIKMSQSFSFKEKKTEKTS